MKYDFQQVNGVVDSIQINLGSTGQLSNAIKAQGEAYRTLAFKFIELYNRRDDDEIKLRHAVTVYGLSRMHKALIRDIRTSQQSWSNRLSSYVFTNEADEIYYQHLKKHIDELAPCLQEYLNTDDSKEALLIKGFHEARSYDIGEALKPVLKVPFESLTQFERKLFVWNYFDGLQEQIDKTLGRFNRRAAGGNAVAYVLGGPTTLVVGLVFTAFTASMGRENAKTIERSFERNAFSNYLDPWKDTLSTLLLSSEDAISLTQGTPENVSIDTNTQHVKTLTI